MHIIYAEEQLELHAREREPELDRLGSGP